MERKDAPPVELIAVLATLRHRHMTPLPGELQSRPERGDVFVPAGWRYLPSASSRAILVSKWPPLAPPQRHQAIIIVRAQYEQAGHWCVRPHAGKMCSAIVHHSLDDESIINIRDWYLLPVSAASSDAPIFHGDSIAAEQPRPMKERLLIKLSGAVKIFRHGQPLLSWTAPHRWTWTEYGISCTPSQCHRKLVDIWHHVAMHGQLPLPPWIREQFPLFSLPARILAS